jgi:zinc protease
MRTIAHIAGLAGLVGLTACAGTPPPVATTASGARGAEASSKGISKAPPAPVHAAKVRTVEGISEYTLPNGLRVLLFPDPTQSTVTVNVTYFVGSRHEGYGETGMAHLLEHMTFKGTPAHHNILKLIDARGGHANGSTWNDRTNYFETLGANGDNLEWALTLEADRMINCTIAADELKTEFSVVRNEFEMGENRPQSILEERMTSAAYLWHNYGKSTIGSRADIERVPPDALRAFYKKYYQPDNAMLVVAGKFEPAATLASVEKIFGTLERPSRALPQTYTVEPVQDGERSVTLRRNGDVHVVGTTYHIAGGASADYTAASAAVSILTRKPSGRLYKSLVETKLASNINGIDYQFRDPSTVVFIAEVRDGKNLPKVKDTLVAGVESLGASKIEEAEVERWRNENLKQYDLLMANSEELAIRLSEFAALGDWRTLFSTREQIKKVSVADVTRVAKAFFKQSNRTLGEFIPTKDADRAPLEETPDVAAIVKGIEGGAGVEQGEAFAATIENIESHTARRQLKNGLQAAFLPKKNRGGKVLLSLRMHFGDEKTLANKAAAAALAGSMLSRGTTKHSYQDLQDAKDKLRSSIRVVAAQGALTVEIETLRDQLPGAIDLVAEMLTTSNFPGKEFEVARQEVLTRYEQGLSDPATRASIELRRTVSPWPKSDPRYVMSPEEAIAAYKKVTLGEAKSFYQEFMGGGHGEVAVVGDFDPAAIGSKLDATLGSWVSKKPYARLTRKVFDVQPATKTVQIKDKEMAQINLRADVALRDDNADYPAWVLLGQIVGGDTASRIWMRLRESEGLSYGAGVWTEADALDEVGSTQGYAIVAPQNADKALASILDEYKKASTGVVTPEELARAKEAWSKALDTNLSNDSYVLHKLAEGLFTKRTLTWSADLRTKIKAVTTDDIARVAKKYLHPEKLVVVKAGDMTKTAAAPKP